MSIEAMKQALEALGLLVEERSFEAMDDGYAAITTLRTAIKQAEKQEPVAWVEPEFWSYLERSNCGTAYRLPDGARQPLYTTPQPQREWVGLTEEEHTQIAVDAGCMSSDWVFYGAAVERALKEKNK
jgi:hypothetical protein